MSLINSDIVRAELAAIWPKLKFVVLSDPAWMAPLVGDLRDYLRLRWRPARPPYLARLSECEEFALGLVAHQRRWHAEQILAGADTGTGNWPLGIVVGTKFGGRDIDHWANICRTADAGIVLIEPQTCAVWPAAAAGDQIYFLLM